MTAHRAVATAPFGAKINAAKTTLHHAASPRCSPDRVAHPSGPGYSFTTRSTHKLVVLARLFVLFLFVVLAQHFTVRVHFNANLLPLLLNNGFIIGAFLLPAND
jgi:hypothetical protein